MRNRQLLRCKESERKIGVEETQKIIQSENKLSILADYCVAFITSISRKVSTGLTLYEGTKASVHQTVKSAAAELAKYYIRVNDIAPGLIPTQLNQTIWKNHSTLWQPLVDAIPLGFTGTPDEAAQAINFILQAHRMTGSTITIDGGRSVNFLGKDIQSKGELQFTR